MLLNFSGVPVAMATAHLCSQQALQRTYITVRRNVFFCFLNILGGLFITSFQVQLEVKQREEARRLEREAMSELQAATGSIASDRDEHKRKVSA